jgi:TolA-binding protein
MSDRRSFSEIPLDARVERVWKRLQADLVGPRRWRRPASRGFALALSVATFVLGVFVGSRWIVREQAPLSIFGAEPVTLERPAAAPALESKALSEATRDAPPVRQSRRVSGVRRADVVSATVALAPPEWQRLADEGQYAQALSAVEQSGGFDGALRGANADELMSLVDIARATGQRDRAVLALRQIVSEHGADPNAPVAAWMLGNELAKAHDLGSAEQAFAMYRALSPAGDFAEDALARQIDMASEQGNLDHARRLADQYLKEFPDGPRTADIQADLARWSHEPKVAGSAGPSGREADDPFAPDAGGFR